MWPHLGPDVPQGVASRAERYWVSTGSVARPTPLRWCDTVRTGATLSENMSRLGHATAAASLIYQDVVAGRDEEVAAALSALAVGTADLACNGATDLH